MDRGFSERAIVIVKRSTNEIMVTWMRVKLTTSDKDVRGKGQAMLTLMEVH